MKNIRYIDEYNSKTLNKNGMWVIAEPFPAFGIWKWIIRFYFAFACLRGKAIAVKFHK